MPTLLLLCLLLLTSIGLTGESAWASLPTSVRVRLFSAHPNSQPLLLKGSVQLVRPIFQTLPAQSYTVKSNAGRVQLCPQNTRQHPCILQAGTVILKAKPGHPIRLQGAHMNERSYPGIIEIKIDAHGQLQLINELPTRTYVALVIASETFPGWPIEALKAQAVLTQTRLSRYHPGDEFIDSTQQEAFLGLSHENPTANHAVSAVWGQILTYQGRPIIPYYHASCGGHTSDARLFNPNRSIPWLFSVRCPYCAGSPFFKPTQTRISTAAFQRGFPAGLPTIIQRDAAGRPLTFQFSNGKTMSGYHLWLRLGQTLGWDKAPGTRFSIAHLSDGTYLIQSTGAGHGVGLCQWGAATMAKQGKNYRNILHFYFPATHLTPVK